MVEEGDPADILMRAWDEMNTATLRMLVSNPMRMREDSIRLETARVIMRDSMNKYMRQVAQAPDNTT